VTYEGLCEMNKNISEILHHFIQPKLTGND
jgi:hypothetical protein